MKYKCIVSDLDMTLLGTGSALSQKTKEVLGKLMEKGIVVVPASGRPFGAFPKEILDMEGIQYGITSNGASIYDLKTGKALYASKLSAGTAGQVMELLSGYELTYEGYIDGKAYTSQAYFDDPVRYGAFPAVVEYIRSTREPVEDIRRFLLENREQLDCIDVIVRQEIKQEVYKRIQEEISGIYLTTSASHLIEISGAESGKHSGMQRLAKMLGFELSEIVAFGDGDNDSEMLREAGLGVAVANATAKCREAADLVTDYNHLDGVPKALVSIFSEIL
ncbi:HAD family hydrolase [Roseburia hominis]